MVALVVAIGGGQTFAQELGPVEPIRPDFLEFLKYEFNSVPAQPVVANLSKSTCRHKSLPKPKDSQVSFELYLCDVDLGCNDVEPVPVWVMADGTLGFAPDSPEQVVYFACPDSISDVGRRAEIAKELALPGGGVTRIK